MTIAAMQELTEARALAEAAQRKADKLIAVARKAAGEVHAARAVADAEHALAEAERCEKAEFKAAKERVSHQRDTIQSNMFSAHILLLQSDSCLQTSYIFMSACTVNTIDLLAVAKSLLPVKQFVSDTPRE